MRFTIVAKVVDNDRPQLYDEVTIEVTYGWATFTVCVQQPSSPTIANSGDQPGHAYYVIEATELLIEHCRRKYESPMLNGTDYAFSSLIHNTNAAWGLYPASSNPIVLTGAEVAGEVRNDTGRINASTAKATFYISLDQYFNGLSFTKEARENTNMKYRIKNTLDPEEEESGTNDNPSNEHNCVDFVIEAAYAVGVGLELEDESFDITVNGSFLGISYSPTVYHFRGKCPYYFGEMLKGLSNGQSGSYEFLSSTEW